MCDEKKCECLKIEAGKQYALDCGFKAIISVDDGDRGKEAFPLHGYYFDKDTQEWLANSWTLNGRSSLKGLNRYAIACVWKEPRRLVRWLNVYEHPESLSVGTDHESKGEAVKAGKGIARLRVEYTEGEEPKIYHDL